METNQVPVVEQKDVDEQSKAREIVRKVVLATVGAGVVAVEAITTLVERMIARGEQARNEARMRAETVEPEQTANTTAPAEVNELQSRVEQLKAELESLQSSQAPEERPQI